MKKFYKIFYCLLMALIIFSLPGCSLDNRSSNSTGSSGSNNTTTTSNVMVLNAVTFAKGETYKLYKGSGVTTSLGNSAKYYVAPITGDSVTMNLDFASTLTSGEPFVVCDSSDTVVFAYNPNGLGNNFASKDVKVTSGTTGQLSYSSLALSSVSASSLTTGYDENPIEIVLTASDTATVNNTKLTANNYIWHLSPDVGEYWTNGDSTEQLDEDEVLAAVTSADGVYIARDIRYVPNTLEFSDSQTAAKAKDDTETMYVVYYNKGASDKLTVQSDDTYILAALPTSMGNAQPGGNMGGGNMGGGDMGGTPPDGSTGGPGGGTDGGTPPSGGPGGSFAPSAVTSFSDIVKAMTHSASDAYDNPVLHITKAGTYKISGTWNGQIWVDIPDESTAEDLDTEDDDTAHVILILNGVTVNCNVAPALVFKNVYEYGLTASSDVASDYNSNTFSVGPNLAKTNTDEIINAGATVVLVSGTTNTFTGTNVARINRLKLNDDDGYSETESDLKGYVKSLKKMYKLDGAFHSRMSMVIADDGSSSTPGKLIVKSDYEGLDSEMHMYIESGNISVTADDDGINVNEDDVSVFHMNGGTLTINSSGGDGIDSNGYLIFKGGNLNITAGSSKQNSAGEAGIDAEKGVYIYSDSAYTWSAASSSTTTDDESGSSTTTQTNSDGSTTETKTNSDGSSTSITKDADGNTTETVKTNADGSSTTTVTNPTTDEEVATITLKASASDITRSPLTADQRRAQGVLTSGTNFKLVDTYNDFGGVK
ncbi:MAG: carbohydrate-binding domain-containing protein [Synergistaceae bacterium]|nr:carbohydrate-binding domain-containing protein [Synergistaceae bacterium]